MLTSVMSESSPHRWLIESQCVGLTGCTEAVARALVDHTVDSMAMAVLATTLNWSPRRLNPAASFLVAQGNAEGTETLGSAPYRYYQLRRTPSTKRFVRAAGLRA